MLRKKSVDLKDKFKTACGKDIFLREDNRKHFLAHPDVLEFVEEAISKIVIPDGATHFEEAISLGRVVGEATLIEAEKISPDQKTTFALRFERKFPSRVIVGESGIPCDSVTVVTRFDELKKEYYLSTAYIGYPCPDEPVNIKDKTSDDFKEALDFWCSHSLIFDSKTMNPIFETSWEEVLNTPKVQL